MKSLLIISLPRSASTTLERVCSNHLQTLGFRRKGEFLNEGFKNKLKVPQYATSDKHFDSIKHTCLKHKEDCIVRDVVQPFFISLHIDWLKEHFNIIHLLRPVKEIQICCRLLGWRMPMKKRQKYWDMLRDLPESGSLVRLKYYDFVQHRPKKLFNILKKWYPDVKPHNYIDRGFIAKRNITARKIKNYRGKI